MGAKQTGKINKAGMLTIDVLASTANIFAAATNRTNIHNKTGGMCH